MRSHRLSRQASRLKDALPLPTAAAPHRAQGLALAAMAAAGTAAWVHRRARRAEQRHPPIGEFVEIDGVRLHYLERGSGSPVVLLHGNSVLLQDFIGSGLVDRLAERHRVIAFDRPGFGYTERPRDRLWNASAQAELLSRAFAQLGIGQAVVLGHSWGTLAALALALDHPADVRGLVLLGGYYFPTARLDVLPTLPVAIPVLGDAMRYTVAPVMGRLMLKGAVKAMFSPAPVPDDFFGPLSREMMLRPGQIGANAEDAAFMVPDAAALRKRYGSLQVPVRILAGKDDRIVDAEAHSGRLHQELPNSSLTIVPEVGHMIHYAAPELIVTAVDAMSSD